MLHKLVQPHKVFQYKLNFTCQFSLTKSRNSSLKRSVFSSLTTRAQRTKASTIADSNSALSGNEKSSMNLVVRALMEPRDLDHRTGGKVFNK